jgi:hypothetical protein
MQLIPINKLEISIISVIKEITHSHKRGGKKRVTVKGIRFQSLVEYMYVYTVFIISVTLTYFNWYYKNWFPLPFLRQCHHMSLMDFVVSPPGWGRSVTDFWGWDAHETQLRCPDEMDGDIWIWSTRRGLNLSSTKLPRPWSPWESFPSRKYPYGRTENRTRDLMISSQKLWPLDHEAGQVSATCTFIKFSRPDNGHVGRPKCLNYKI